MTAGIGADLGRRALGDLAPEVEHHDPVADPSTSSTSCSMSSTAMPRSIGEPSDEIAELARLVVVEAGRRLVEQQDRRRRRDRAGDPDETASTVGQLAREAVEVVLEPELADAAHRGRRERVRPGQNRSREPGERRVLSGAGVQVLGDRDLLEQLERLERAADARTERAVPGSSERPTIGVAVEEHPTRPSAS